MAETQTPTYEHPAKSDVTAGPHSPVEVPRHYRNQPQKAAGLPTADDHAEAHQLRDTASLAGLF